ncbi:MAG: ABC transporter ATP-binding protein [Fimbriimonadaceae bacterium]|nr:ABC transporter ATP-binding protein [Fimbriimonadaceae bacterium]
MLEVRQLVKDYRKTRAVDEVSFVVAPGEIVGLLGPNGAGKTTALRCIAGILKPTAGQVLINGFDIVEDQARAKAGLAFVPEVPGLYDLLTVDEHLRFVAMCFDKLDVYDAEKETLLERYNLLEKRNELVATLSKGMKQKLAVACALVHDANVMLLDEPMIGIDPAGAHELKMELARARDAGAAVLVSTHLLDTAEKLCDRVIILARGKKLTEGTLAELRDRSQMTDASLEDLFLSLTQDREPTNDP